MCDISRAEVGTVVVGITNDFSNLQVYKPQIQRIPWAGRNPHRLSKVQLLALHWDSPNNHTHGHYTQHGWTQWEKTASENFQVYVHRSVISRGLVTIQPLDPPRDPWEADFCMHLSALCPFSAGYQRSLSTCTCKFAESNSLSADFKILLIYFHPLKKVAHKCCPLARGGEKRVLIFKMLFLNWGREQ